MEFDDMKRLWKSPANVPSPIEVEQIKAQLAQTLRRRYRTLTGFLVWVITALLVISGFVLYHVFAGHQLQLQKNWAVLLLLAIQWLFALGFLWQYRLHRREHSRYSDCISNALRTALDENRVARSRSKGIGLIYLFGIPALAVAVYQLQTTGRMTGKESFSMLVLFAVTLAVSGSWAVWRYYRKLLPEKKELEALLHDHSNC